MTKRAVYLASGSALLLSAGISGGAVLIESKPDTGMFIYETATVSKGDIRKLVATSGTVRPRMTVQVGSELSGRVKEIVADFNVSVKAGDLLAVIDPKTFESKAKQAKADLLSAEAALVNSAAAIRKAASVLMNAEKVFDRQQLLGNKGLATGVNMDSSERDLNVARAELDVAKANLENAKAVVAQKTAQLDQANIDLDRTQIRAPISGIVLHRSIDVGQTVAASFQAPELFRLAGDLSSIHIEAQVSEADIGAVRRGQAVTFDVDAHPKRSFAGRVEQVRLSPATADSVVTYTVIIEAENAKLELFPGMTANVRIETAKRDDVLRIATDAIRFKPPKQARTAIADTSIWGRSKLLAMRTLGLNGAATTSEQNVDELEPNDAAVHRWARRLKLDERQVAEFTELSRNLGRQYGKALASKAVAKSKSGQGSGSQEEISPYETVLEPLLTPEQRSKFAAIKREREGTQRATIWVLAKDGALERRSIRVGLADVQHVELASNEMRPGDEVVVRSRKARAQ